MNTDGEIQRALDRVHDRKADPMRDPEALEPHDTFFNGWLPLPSTGVPEHPPGKLEMRNEDGQILVVQAEHRNVFKGCKTSVDSTKATAYCFTPSKVKERDISAEAGWFWVYNGECNEKHLFMGMPLECKLDDGTFVTTNYRGSFLLDVVAARRVKPKAKPARIPPRIILDEPLEDWIAAEKLADAKRAFNGDENMAGRALMAQHFAKPINGRDIQDIEAYERFRRSPRGQAALAQIGKSFEVPVAPLGESAMLEIFGQALSEFEAEIERKKK